MEFISEDDLDSFTGFLKYQGVDLSCASIEERAFWQREFEEGRQRAVASPKIGLMAVRSVPGEHRYGVAVREGTNLWLTLWVRRSRRGEFFIMHPRTDGTWDPHTSYHLDGTLHMKSFNRKRITRKLQPLTAVFKGSEHLGAYGGHGPKSIGAVCDPAAFSGVLEVAPGVLGPRDGMVTVDLVEPGHEPLASLPWMKIVAKQTFTDCVPYVVAAAWTEE